MAGGNVIQDNLRLMAVKTRFAARFSGPDAYQPVPALPGQPNNTSKKERAFHRSPGFSNK